MAPFQTLDDLGSGGRVLVRVDLNSPIEEGAAVDNQRFASHAETVRELATDHAIILLAHQGRPGRDDFTSLESHSEVLSTYLDRQVEFVPDIGADWAIDSIRDTEVGDVLLLENTRMATSELPESPPVEHATSDLVQTLAPLVDAYVNDAFSVAHRAHASTVGFPFELPSYAGRVMEREYAYNTGIAERARSNDGQVTMVLGGNKSEDVIRVIDVLGDVVDTILLGGLPGELFLRAEGYPLGYDVGGQELLDDQWDSMAQTIHTVLDERDDQLVLPSDLAYERPDGTRAEVDVEAIPEKTDPYLDIGLDTIQRFEGVLRDSAAIFVKGGLGVFEDERFADGTVSVLQTIAETDCVSVVGGGDTTRTITRNGLDEEAFDHRSIAGGAYLEALTGEGLIAAQVLASNAKPQKTDLRS